MADTNYRPARLPYASVVGPLNFELEPEREPPRNVHLWVQNPGYVGGAPRGPADLVPPPGSLTVRLDDGAQATLALSFGAREGQPMVAVGNGPAVADAIQAAIQAAATGGGFELDGVAVTDPAAVDELARATARWDGALQRIVIASGRRGVVDGPESTARRASVVEVEGALAEPLGLGDGASPAPGRVVRHRRPNPRAVVVDVRFDLWAGSQLALADALDAWARVTPTRGQLLERPALLAAGAGHGDTSVRLQGEGESPTRWTLVQLERVDGRFADRHRDRDVELVDGATVDGDGVRATGTGRATLAFREPPPVPYAWLPDAPGADGYALSFGLRIEPGGAAGDAGQVVAVEHQGLVALAVDAALVQENGTTRCRLRATAQREDGTDHTPAVATVPVAATEAGVEVHALVDATGGVVSLFVDGDPLATVASAPARSPGGDQMLLTVGDAGSTPLALRVSHVQVHGSPLGPVDPRLRRSIAPASAWRPGDTVHLATSDDGVTPVGEPFVATVVAVEGDRLNLDRPVQGSFPRGRTLAYRRALFFSQRQLRRQDDLMNQLYRICLEYRVSTFLDERFPAVSAPVAEVAEVEVRDLARLSAELADPERPEHPLRPSPGHPGTRAVLTSPVHDGPAHSGPAHSGPAHNGSAQEAINA